MLNLKSTCLLVLCVLAASVIKAQSQLIFDFNKGEFTKGINTSTKKINPIPYGGFVTLKVININTFRYKVELEGNSVNYLTPIPSELQTIFRLSGENFDNANLVKALNIGSVATNTMQALEEKTGDELKDAKDSAAEAAKKADEAAKNAGGQKAKKVDPKATQEKEVKSKEAEAEVKTKAELKKSMEALVDACEEYIAIAKKISNIKFVKIQLITISKQKFASHGDLATALPAALSEQQMKKDYMEFSEYYTKAYALYNKAIDAAGNAGDEDKKEMIEKAEEQIEESFNLFAEDNFLKMIEDVILLQDALAKDDYFTVSSAPIQIDGDYVNFNLKITPTPVNNLMPFENGKAFPVEIPARGGLKVDFSVGPYISLGKNSKDEVYYFDAAGDSSKLKQRSNNNAISPGIAAMMHFGPRSGTETRFAGMFGVAAGFQSEQDVNFSLLVGGSVVFGKRERVMLSTGISFLKVDRLKKDQYVVDKTYPSDTPIADVTEKVFKGSFFIGLSYNLTNRLDIK